MSQPFSWDEWGQLSAVDLAKHVRRRDVIAAEVAGQARAAALRVEQLGAVVELFDTPAVAPDIELPADVQRQGLLAGVPLFLKDLGSSVAGLKRENGSALHRGERVKRTDPLPADWLREGVQVVGRATTAELGMGYDTSTVYEGLQVTRNPWDPARTAGGSSGGSAALVAAGVVPIAHATDGAGSIRQPAALNGLVGLKVSRGRLALPWHVNELLNTSMVEGVLARSLEDAALALDAATARPLPRGKQFSAGSLGEPAHALAGLREPVGRLRVGFTTDAFGRHGECEPERAARVREVAAALARDGHRVEEIAPRDLPDWTALWRSFETFWAGMRAASWRLVHGELSPAQLEELSPMVRGYWHASERYGKHEVMRYLGDNVHITLGFARLLERHEVLLLPVVPYATPAANGALSPAVAQDFDAFFQAFLDAGRYTIPANEAGLPALSVPAGLDATGMPVAVQVYGRWREEAALLRAGAAVQRTFADTRQLPGVHVSNA